jgi:hypothetical protein
LRVLRRCGGCALQHLAHDAQVRFKQGVVAQALARIARVEPEEWLPPFASRPWRYRRRARLGVKYVPGKERVLVGFRERSAPYITDMAHCPVLMPPLDALLGPLAELIARTSIKGRLPQIEAAVGTEASALVLRVLDAPSAADIESFAAFGAAHGLDMYLQPGGPGTIAPIGAARALSYSLEQFGVTLRFQPTDFVQVNAEVNAELVATAVRLADVQPSDSVLDLYCGLGNFSLPFAQRARELLGVEGEAGLVARAVRNAELNGIANTRFLTGRSHAAWLELLPRAARRRRARSTAYRRRGGSRRDGSDRAAAHRLRVVPSRDARARRAGARGAARVSTANRPGVRHVPAHASRRGPRAVRARLIRPRGTAADSRRRNSHDGDFESTIPPARIVMKLTVTAALAAAIALSASGQETHRQVLGTSVVPTRYQLTVTPDAPTLTLSGEVRIDIEVAEPTNVIAINALELTFDDVTLDGGGQPDVAFDQTAQTARLTFPEPVTAGRHSLAITYRGKIYRTAQALFAYDYPSDHGTERILATQFEIAEARRFVPSFDQPDMKAVWEIAAVVPQDRSAVSNMPEAGVDRVSESLKRVRFAPTPEDLVLPPIPRRRRPRADHHEGRRCGDWCGREARRRRGRALRARQRRAVAPLLQRLLRRALSVAEARPRRGTRRRRLQRHGELGSDLVLRGGAAD